MRTNSTPSMTQTLRLQQASISASAHPKTLYKSSSADEQLQVLYTTMTRMGSDSASVTAIKAALCSTLMVALSVQSCAFAGRVLDEQPAAAPPVEAPLPADPLPVPTEPPADPVVVPAAVPAALPLPPNAAGGAGVAAIPGVGVAGAGTASVGSGAGNHPLTFFMHDILGGSQQSAPTVTGVVAPPQVATNLTNSNNVPYVAGLGASSANLFQNNGGNKKTPFVNAGDLPSGPTLQNLLFGTTTVIDDELTEGHELGATVIGRGHGFYVTSSQDGTSKTIVLTAMFEGEGDGCTLGFFGVYRMATPESHIAVIGGTGKYENAEGYAAIQTLHPGDQHTTDGVETFLQFNIYLS